MPNGGNLTLSIPYLNIVLDILDSVVQLLNNNL
jgi:hypothetical protein